MKLRNTALGRLYLKLLIYFRNTSPTCLVFHYKEGDEKNVLRLIRRYERKGFTLFSIKTFKSTS